MGNVKHLIISPPHLRRQTLLLLVAALLIGTSLSGAYVVSAQASPPRISLSRAEALGKKAALRECQMNHQWRSDRGFFIWRCKDESSKCQYAFPNPKYHALCDLGFRVVGEARGETIEVCSLHSQYCTGIGTRVRCLPPLGWVCTKGDVA
jgi:hypothetical protein